MEEFKIRERERKMMDKAWGSYQIELDRKLRRIRLVESVKDICIFMVTGLSILFILSRIGII